MKNQLNTKECSNEGNEGQKSYQAYENNREMAEVSHSFSVTKSK